MRPSNCDHREMEGYEYSLSKVGPKCHRTAAYTYEWDGDEVNVCEMHSRDVRDAELVGVES
jgi:hypothetical protein